MTAACETSLNGLVVLLVEDEFLIAIEAQDILHDLGVAQTKTASTLQQAQNTILNEAFDIAILDVNLNGEMSFPLIETLERRGKPFLFASGYNLERRRKDLDIPEAICVAKPYDSERLSRALTRALAARA